MFGDCGSDFIVTLFLKYVKLYQTCSYAILQGAFIEDVGGEGTESWVHAILDLQADRPDPQHH